MWRRVKGDGGNTAINVKEISSNVKKFRVKTKKLQHKSGKLQEKKKNHGKTGVIRRET